MSENAKGLLFLCCYCRSELSETQIFEFRGTVGCERCIRDYYRDRPDQLESQLQLRRRNALTWVTRNRKSLERHARRAEAPTFPTPTFLSPVMRILRRQ